MTPRSRMTLLVPVLLVVTVLPGCNGESCDAITCSDGVNLEIAASDFTVALPEHDCSFRCQRGLPVDNTCTLPHDTLIGVECRSIGAFVIFQDPPSGSLQVQAQDLESSASFDGTVQFTVETEMVGDGGECSGTCEVGRVAIPL